MGSPSADAGEEVAVVDAYHYTDTLTSMIRQACTAQGKDEISAWCLEQRRTQAATDEESEEDLGVGALEEHVCTVLATSGVADFGARERMVAAAIKQVERRRRAQIQKEKAQKEKLKASRTTVTGVVEPTSPKRTGEGSREATETGQDTKDSLTPSPRSKSVHVDMPPESRASKELPSSLSAIAATFASALGGPTSPFAPPAVGDADRQVETLGEDIWKEVQTFKTQEEALRFVLACQPFDYQPVRKTKATEESGGEGKGKVRVRMAFEVSDEEQFPKWGSGREAFEWVMEHMSPWPSEFVSISNDFKRQLRIREANAEEKRKQQEKEIRNAVQSAHRLPARERTGLAKASRNALLLPKVRAAIASGQVTGTVKEVKPWIVEAAGTLFQRPVSLRDLVHESSLAKSGSGGSLGNKTVYYIAVAPSEEKQILLEGYRVTRRVSIPCSCTPKDAIAAFNRHAAKTPTAQHPPEPGADFREKREPAVKVLAVTLPPELGIDVVAHRKGGFLIRCQELPPRCFKRLNKSGAAAEGA